MLLKKPTFYLAIAGTAVTVALVLKLNARTPDAPPPVPPAVKTAPDDLAASGIIEARSENVAIGVPEAGLVTKLHVAVWDRVKQGQPLLVLDERELQAQLAVQKANTAIAIATLVRLDDQLALLKSVRDPRAVSADEVRTRENDVAVARAQLAAAEAEVQQTEVRIERLTVCAPRDGTVLQVNVRPGEYAAVSPRSPAILLGDADNLQVRADVDEQNVARLQAGQEATAYTKGDTARPIPLRFVRIEPFVVPKTSLTGASTERVDTRVLQVIYAFERPQDRALYVGQQVDLFINAGAPALNTTAQLSQTTK